MGRRVQQNLYQILVLLLLALGSGSAQSEVLVATDLELQGTPFGSPQFGPSQVSDQTLTVVSNGQGVSLPHAANISASDDDFALAFWYRPTESFTGAWRAVTFKGNAANERNFSIWLRPNDNRVHFRISTTSAWNEGGDSVSPLIINQWHHIAYVKDGNQLKLYLMAALTRRRCLPVNP